MRSDLDMSFVEIVFAALHRRWFFDDRLAFDDVDVWFPIIDDLRFGCLTGRVDLFLTDERRVTVEIRICKPLRRRTGIIDDVEPKFSVIIAHARSAPDDLFELGQRADDAGDHDVLTSGRI